MGTGLSKEQRGLTSGSGNIISDEERGLVSPTEAWRRHQRQAAGRYRRPMSPSFRTAPPTRSREDRQRLEFLSEALSVSSRLYNTLVQRQIRVRCRPERQTERMVQQEIVGMRQEIPCWGNPSLMVFDSIFWSDRSGGMGDEWFNFRGIVMRGFDVNYYFQGMAAAHQGLSWSATRRRILLWNIPQAALPGRTLQEEFNLRLQFAAVEGYHDELRRLLNRGR